MHPGAAAEGQCGLHSVPQGTRKDTDFRAWGEGSPISEHWPATGCMVHTGRQNKTWNNKQSGDPMGRGKRRVASERKVGLSRTWKEKQM